MTEQPWVTEEPWWMDSTSTASYPHLAADTSAAAREPAFTWTESTDRILRFRAGSDTAAQTGLPGSLVTTTGLPFPVAGAVRVEDQAYVASGFGGWGRSTGVPAGQLLAARITATEDDGKLPAGSARCTHLDCIVRFDDAETAGECPRHGSRLDAGDRAPQGPANRPLTTEEDL